MENSKQERLLEIFFRGLRGEDLSVQRLADEYEMSTKSITRNINDLKAFLADHRELVGNTELQYSHQSKCYRLYMDEFLTNKELFALVEVMIGARAFSKMELLTLVDKLRKFTTAEDRKKLNELIGKELYHYPEVKHDCESVQDTLWQLINCISDKCEISIEYYRMDRKWVTHRLRPASVMFTDHYFYLIAFGADGGTEKPLYFRIDRIKHITTHRKKFDLGEEPEFDEGSLRERSLFMWPGQLRTIRFEFNGPSVQAVLDKLPTAKIIERSKGKYLIEAEVYGDGNDQGKYVWEKIRDKQLTAAPCFAGKLYEKSDTRLMVVGRAVNGWEIAFGECNDPASTTVSILNQQFSFDDIVNPEGIPYPEEPEKRNYQYYSSNFWRLAKFVLEEYEESEPTTPLSNTWYTDKLCWNERVVWSNLYKVAPRKGNNPEWAFIKPQMQVYIDIMKEEIELYSPKRVLFITNSDYFAPWKRQPSFAKEFGVELDPGASGAVVGAGIYFDTKMIVCKRPDVFGMSHQEIATMAKEIKTAFEAL